MQAEELESLTAELESLQRKKEALAAEVKISQENADGIQAEIQEGYKHKDKEISELKLELGGAKETVDNLTELNKGYVGQITELEEQLTSDQGASKQDHVEVEKLRAKAELLEEQNKELKQEGVDFKTTILAAQNFADNLRQTTEEEAQRLMEEARADVEKFRKEAQNELALLPQEIEELQTRKREVREELKATLHSYLEALDVFPDAEADQREDELAELFQKIDIPDSDGIELEPEEIGKLS